MATVIRKRQADPSEIDDWGNASLDEPRYRYEYYVADDGHAPAAREHLRELRARGVEVGWLLGDIVPAPPGSTRRGIPTDYTGDDPNLCNARTHSGKPCRALKLAGGRCKWHGGLSTGPTTSTGNAKCAMNLRAARKRER